MNLPFDVLIFDHLGSSESDFIESTLFFQGIDTINYIRKKGIPEISTNSLLIMKNPDRDDLELLNDWAKDPMVILKTDHSDPEMYKKMRVHKIWDLAKISISYFSVFMKYKEKIHGNFYIASGNHSFSKTITGIFKMFNTELLLHNSVILLIQEMKIKKPSFLILDWDTIHEEVWEAGRLLQEYKNQERYFPLCACVKDFSADNLFRDLSGTIKTFGRIFYQYDDIIKLVLSSLPIRTLQQQSEIENSLGFRLNNSTKYFEWSEFHKIQVSEDQIYSWIVNQIYMI